MRKKKSGTPDSPLYGPIRMFSLIWRMGCQKLHIDDTEIRGLKPPFVVFCNHESFYDFFYMGYFLKDYRPAFVINRHIMETPVLGKVLKEIGMIPKRLFTPDMAAVKMLKTIRAGHPVVVFPEGCLSVDGTNNPISGDLAALLKHAGTDLVIAKISGAYFTYPKWRKAFYRSDVFVKAERVITKDEIRAMTPEDLNKAISDALTYDESEGSTGRFPQKRRAEGLDKILYRCADCGALYTTKTEGADLYCTACGKRHHLDETYHFTDEIGTIHKYYDRIRQMEREELDDISLTADVDVKIFPQDGAKARREKGVCAMDKRSFHYSSKTTGTDFTIPMEKIQALAFSCDEEFELYYDNELYYFYPEENRRQVTRWSLVADLIREEIDDREE